ncbi:neuritin-like [Passerculus sandwichensis]
MQCGQRWVLAQSRPDATRGGAGLGIRGLRVRGRGCPWTLDSLGPAPSLISRGRSRSLAAAGDGCPPRGGGREGSAARRCGHRSWHRHGHRHWHRSWHRQRSGAGARARRRMGQRQRRGPAVLLLALGHLAGLLAAGPACADAYRGLSDCVLKLGDSMATYEEEEGIELQGLHRVCRYWDEFHTCALTVLWECQKEAAAVWEMLRRESRKTKFQGSLFDLCSPSMAQSSAWTHVPNISILSVPLIVTWLNL